MNPEQLQITLKLGDDSTCVCTLDEEHRIEDVYINDVYIEDIKSKFLDMLQEWVFEEVDKKIKQDGWF